MRVRSGVCVQHVVTVSSGLGRGRRFFFFFWTKEKLCIKAAEARDGRTEARDGRTEARDGRTSACMSLPAVVPPAGPLQVLAVGVL
jgi:hypothetical protein